MSETDPKPDIVTNWWQTHLANRESGRARALAARLRRADAIAVLAEPEVHDLAKRLGMGPKQADVLVRLVQVLAHVRADDRQTLARRMGLKDPGDTSASLSALRFQRLLRLREGDLAEALRRALPMVDRRCNIHQLGWDLRLWDHPDQGDAVRTRWTFDYFGATPPETNKPQYAATESSQ